MHLVICYICNGRLHVISYCDGLDGTVDNNRNHEKGQVALSMPACTYLNAWCNFSSNSTTRFQFFQRLLQKMIARCVRLEIARATVCRSKISGQVRQVATSFHVRFRTPANTVSSFDLFSCNFQGRNFLSSFQITAYYCGSHIFVPLRLLKNV